MNARSHSGQQNPSDIPALPARVPYGDPAALGTNQVIRPSVQPGIPRPRGSAPGDQLEIDLVSARRCWDAVDRARAEYAPLVLDAAESEVAALYEPLAHLLAHRHGPDPHWEPAAKLGLRKAIQCWSRPDQPSGFAEYARGAIEAEIRAAVAHHAVDRHPPAALIRRPRGHPEAKPTDRGSSGGDRRR